VDKVESNLWVNGKNRNLMAFGPEHSDGWEFVGKVRVARSRPIVPQTAADISVDTVEITWSDFTHGIKDVALADDVGNRGRENERHSTSTSDSSCFEASSILYPASPLPARAKINRYLKEFVLDREMADAMLYAGPYKSILQHAVAEGICDAITMSELPVGQTPPDTASCNWESAGHRLMKSDTVFVFVTHSLGSLMLYNVFINLKGLNQYGDNVFDTELARDKAAAVTISALSQQTPVVYMMANQISMLGLASNAALANLLAGGTVIENIKWARRTLGEDSYSGGSDTTAMDRAPCGKDGVARPKFVAFIDVNDLLSWPVAETMDCRTFEFINIYVHNARWHWVLEWPSTAHAGYFDNDYVGQVMACGLSKGRIPEECSGGDFRRREHP
jgi:hypothetical protein